MNIIISGKKIKANKKAIKLLSEAYFMCYHYASMLGLSDKAKEYKKLYMKLLELVDKEFIPPYGVINKNH